MENLSMMFVRNCRSLRLVTRESASPPADNAIVDRATREKRKDERERERKSARLAIQISNR